MASRRDYVGIADRIADSRHAFKSTRAHVGFAVSMASTLGDTNPRFDRVRFLQACQPHYTIGTSMANEWDAAIRDAERNRAAVMATTN